MLNEAPDFSAMDDQALTLYAARLEKQIADLKELHEGAVTELRGRHTPGTHVYGRLAVEAVQQNPRFNAKLVTKILDEGGLSDEDYASICVTKPDPAKARKKLGKDSALYLSMCDEQPVKIKIREATEDERMIAAAREIIAKAPESADSELAALV